MPAHLYCVSLLYRSAVSLVALILSAQVLHADSPSATPVPPRLKVLWLGDTGHHEPRNRLTDIVGPLAASGIDVAYTEDPADLRREILDRYHALVIYANQTEITADQEAALLEYVESGRGFVPLHCASFCFLNSPKYIALVGGQFLRHGGEVFSPEITRPEHPALRGVEKYETWDETYVHAKLTDDRDVLMERVEPDGRREPWTWTRTQGKGRVFYTASGHDARTFKNPQFHRLVIGGIRWASGYPDHQFSLPETPQMEVSLPNYVKGENWGTTGKPIESAQAPLSVADSMQRFSLPAGFEIRLVAAEPEITKPIAMTWDDRGRTWIAETVDYPNDLKDSGRGNDRIRILTDRNGDGKADDYKLFADKLSIPTGLVWTPYGLIVSQAPDMLLLVDGNSDDVADERRVLFTGFGTDDTHAGPSNLRLGVDGWVYATCGYSGFKGIVGTKEQAFGQGLFRFKPDGSQLEFLASSSNNTWGLGLDELGEVFYSTANGEHSSHMAIPNQRFEAVRGQLGRGTRRMADHQLMHPLMPIRQVDHFGGFTAAAGHAVYTARHFPPEFWNRIAFVCEPTGHLVHMVQITPRGSGFVSRDRANLLASSDEWSAPIVAEVGPDGALWVIDWYNLIVQHNPTPLGYETGKGNAYVTPLRDKTHGRIYRIVATGRPFTATPKLHAGSVQHVIAALDSDNLHWRTLASWTLAAKHKPTEFTAALTKRVTDTKTDPAIAAHALRTLAWLSPQDDVVQRAVHDSRVELRRTAALVNSAPQPGLLTTESDPVTVRRHLLAIAATPARSGLGQEIGSWLGTIREDANDPWFPQAALCAAARNSNEFLAVLASVDGSTPIQTFVVRGVAEHAARGRPSNADVSQWLERIPEALKDSRIAESLLSGLAAGWPADHPVKLSAKARSTVARLTPQLSPDGQTAAVTIADRGGFSEEMSSALAALRTGLITRVRNTNSGDADRIAAAKTLSRLALDDEALSSVLEFVSGRSSPDLARGMLGSLAETSSPLVPAAIFERWTQFTPALKTQAVTVLLSRDSWTNSLLDAMETDLVSIADLKADQVQRLSTLPKAEQKSRAKQILSRSGRLPNPDREAVVKALLPLTEKVGDVAAGKEVFVKNCAKCHKHGDLGEAIGPALTGFNVHPKSKILSEMIDPNRSVEGNFRVYTAELKSGKTLAGLLAAETQTAIELVDTDAKRHTILREDLEVLVSGAQSLMPEGLEKQIPENDFVNLLEFLTAKGKYVPLPLDKAATVVSTKGMFYSLENETERLVFTDWSPKLVGDVPFYLVDPRGSSVNNVVLLHGPAGAIPPTMPKSVSLPCNTAARTIHMLSGVSGWGYPLGEKGSVSLIVRLHYESGSKEDHELKNGEHFADYIRRVDVPGSDFAFDLGGRQIRLLRLTPRRNETIESIEFIKGSDHTAPVVMAVTVETP